MVLQASVPGLVLRSQGSCGGARPIDVLLMTADGRRRDSRTPAAPATLAALLRPRRSTLRSDHGTFKGSGGQHTFCRLVSGVSRAASDPRDLRFELIAALASIWEGVGATGRRESMVGGNARASLDLVHGAVAVFSNKTLDAIPPLRLVRISLRLIM
jgi:hypothetical protein